MNEIRSIFQSIHIPDSAIDNFIELLTEVKLANGSYFIREGNRTSRLGFVKKGLFRNLYLNEEGEECTFSFTAEQGFLYECHAMRSSEPAQYSIQAIEHSSVLEVNYTRWVDGFKDSAWWNKILLDLTSVEVNEKRDREKDLMNVSGGERYARFLNKYSNLESRIKQKYVASYLGITTVSLSRIRKNLGKI